MKHKNIKNKINGQGKINANMSLYEINQGIIGQFPKYDSDQIKDLENRINEWNTKYSESYYFMLLCRDNNYYTIFHLDSELSDFSSLGEGTLGVLIESGYTIHSDEIVDDHCEIWAKNEENTYAFMLFPYDQGVIYYG